MDLDAIPRFCTDESGSDFLRSRDGSLQLGKQSSGSGSLNQTFIFDRRNENKFTAVIYRHQGTVLRGVKP